jgi:hypothetical protein
MKQFILTIDIPTSPVRDSVYVAQMLREAAATVDYQVPMMNSHLVRNVYGVKKYEWTAGDTGSIDAARKRA